MQKLFITTLLCIFSIVGCVYSQNVDTFNVKKWKQLYRSDSIPKMLIYRLGRFNDGYFDIADREKPFQATDFEYDRTLARRQLRYLARNGNAWIMTYKHGGRGLHYHYVYYQVENGNEKALISGVTLRALETLEDINKALFEVGIEFKDLNSKDEADKV